MRRVLIGGFGAIERLGVRGLLDDEGLDVISEEATQDGVIERLSRDLPDVVVVDLDDAGSSLIDLISTRYPSVKVVAFSSRRPRMKVFPAFHHGESYVVRLSPPALIDAVMHT